MYLIKAMYCLLHASDQVTVTAEIVLDIDPPALIIFPFLGGRDIGARVQRAVAPAAIEHGAQLQGRGQRPEGERPERPVGVAPARRLQQRLRL